MFFDNANLIIKNRTSSKKLGGYCTPWKMMQIALTDCSQFFQENKFILTNFVLMYPPNNPQNIENDKFRGYQRGIFATKKLKKIYCLTP